MQHRAGLMLGLSLAATLTPRGSNAFVGIESEPQPVVKKKAVLNAQPWGDGNVREGRTYRAERRNRARKITKESVRRLVEE
jgi:hypothetical protein